MVFVSSHLIPFTIIAFFTALIHIRLGRPLSQTLRFKISLRQYFILVPVFWKWECFQGKQISALEGVVSSMDDHGSENNIESVQNKGIS